MEKNTTVLPNWEYYKLKRFYDTVQNGEHVIIKRGGIGHCNPDIDIYGNTDKIDQMLQDKLEEANQLINDYKSRERKLLKENKEIDRKCIKLQQDSIYIENLEKDNKFMFRGLFGMSIITITMMVMYFVY